MVPPAFLHYRPCRYVPLSVAAQGVECFFQRVTVVDAVGMTAGPQVIAGQIASDCAANGTAGTILWGGAWRTVWACVVGGICGRFSDCCGPLAQSWRACAAVGRETSLQFRHCQTAPESR